MRKCRNDVLTALPRPLTKRPPCSKAAFDSVVPVHPATPTPFDHHMEPELLNHLTTFGEREVGKARWEAVPVG